MHLYLRVMSKLREGYALLKCFSFLHCMEFVLHEGCMYIRGKSPRKYRHSAREGSIIPCTIKTMIQLTCTERPYKGNHWISYGARMSILCSTVCEGYHTG